MFCLEHHVIHIEKGTTMKIATIGRGNVGGGLADLWEKAGHQVTRLGHEGGDVSDAEVVLVAVPGDAIEAALGGITGLEGKTAIDATNLFRGATPPGGHASNAEYVKSVTGGPTAKAFNINFAALFGQVADASTRPGDFWCGDEEAREAIETLHRDAGFEPINAGPLTQAGKQEALFGFVFGIVKDGGMGPFFYKFSSPAEF
jgi:predicted dinucleotide-binding enzyme